MSVKKFLQDEEHDRVKRADILKPGDWILKWNPDAAEDLSGFELYTPSNFDPEHGSGPLGGLILAAVYYLLEHGDRDFPKELISRANELSKEVAEEAKNEGAVLNSSGRTLN